MITLYSTHCPKCKIIEMKLAQKKVDFEMVDDTDAVVEVGRANHILSAPILKVDEKFYDFSGAVKFINEVE